MHILTDVECVARLRQLEAEAQLNSTSLALIVLGRDPRTVRRWLAGDPIPEVVRRWITSIDHVRRDEQFRVRITTKTHAPTFYKVQRPDS